MSRGAGQVRVLQGAEVCAADEDVVSKGGSCVKRSEVAKHDISFLQLNERRHECMTGLNALDNSIDS